MKIFYNTLITIISIITTDAASIATQGNRSPAPSETGSYRTVHATNSNASFSEYQLPDLEDSTFEALYPKYLSLLAKYKVVAEKAQGYDTRVKKFLNDQLKALSTVPGALDGIEHSENKTKALHSAIKNIVSMYKMLELRSTSSSLVTIDRNASEEDDDATIAALTARTAELEETINQLERKPETTETGTDFSPERRIVFSSPARLKRTAETVAKQSEELVALKSEIAELRAQQVAVDLEKASDAKEIEALHLHNSELEAEVQRLKTENASLKAAQKAAESSAKSRTSTSEDNVRTPLLATGTTSSKQNGGQGCPCSIM